MNKRFILLLTAIMISGLFLTGIIGIGTVQAESSRPKPSIPEFSLKFVDRSYDVSPSQSIDPYTGETVTTPGGRVENRTIEITIKNQPFDSKLMYNVRVKGHFSDSWTEVFHPSDGFPIQSDSEYTVLSFSSRGGDDFYYKSTSVIHAPSGGQVDFQVEALNGYISREISVPVPGTGWIFTGEKSGWSSTQTLTIGVNSVGEPEQSQINPKEDSVPNQQFGALNWAEISLFAVLFSVIAVLIIALMYKRKVISKGRTLT